MLLKIEVVILFIENNLKGSVFIILLNELDVVLEGKVGIVIKK